MKKLISWMLALALAMTMMLCPAWAEQEERIADVAMDLMGCSVHYPQLTGLPDAQVQRDVNALIMEKGEINQRLSRVAQLMNSPVKIAVSYDAFLAEGIFSCALLADGAVLNSRSTQIYSTVNVDTRSGEVFSLTDVLTEEGVTRLEALLTELAGELSAHLAAGTLLPLPETFAISPTGLTLYYPIEQFRTLSDRAGTVTVLWSELAPHLQLAEGSVLARIGAAQHLTLAEDAAERLTAAVAEGGLPGIPARIGQPMQTLVDTHHLLNDADLYEGGRMIALESGAFRQVWMLTDSLRRDFASSEVQGIRADRLSLHGLCTGATTQQDWRKALGQPVASHAVDAAQAESWCIVPGVSDYYDLGQYRLRLHADEAGVLRSVFLQR